MLNVINLTKSFENKLIINNFTLNFQEGRIYGLLGTNGAGKSTFLRILAGIYKADKGEVLYNNENIFENKTAKQNIFYIPDENTFLPYKSIKLNINYYKTIYNNFDEEVYTELSKLFNLDQKADIKSFSKGMKKQALLLVSLCFLPKYIILDETFDGLDPLIRIKVKKFLIGLVEEKEITLIISTHNISDIENLVDELIIINNNELIINNFNDEDKYFKVQVAFNKEIDINELGLNVKSSKKLGSVYTVVFQNSHEDIEKTINKLNPLIFDIYNLSKEELFMLEVEEL